MKETIQALAYAGMNRCDGMMENSDDNQHNDIAQFLSNIEKLIRTTTIKQEGIIDILFDKKNSPNELKIIDDILEIHGTILKHIDSYHSSKITDIDENVKKIINLSENYYRDSLNELKSIWFDYFRKIEKLQILIIRTNFLNIYNEINCVS